MTQSNTNNNQAPLLPPSRILHFECRLRLHHVTVGRFRASMIDEGGGGDNSRSSVSRGDKEEKEEEEGGGNGEGSIVAVTERDELILYTGEGEARMKRKSGFGNDEGDESTEEGEEEEEEEEIRWELKKGTKSVMFSKSTAFGLFSGSEQVGEKKTGGDVDYGKTKEKKRKKKARGEGFSGLGQFRKLFRFKEKVLCMKTCQFRDQSTLRLNEFLLIGLESGLMGFDVVRCVELFFVELDSQTLLVDFGHVLLCSGTPSSTSASSHRFYQQHHSRLGEKISQNSSPVTGGNGSGGGDGTASSSFHGAGDDFEGYESYQLVRTKCQAFPGPASGAGVWRVCVIVCGEYDVLGVDLQSQQREAFRIPTQSVTTAVAVIEQEDFGGVLVASETGQLQLFRSASNGQVLETIRFEGKVACTTLCCLGGGVPEGNGAPSKGNVEGSLVVAYGLSNGVVGILNEKWEHIFCKKYGYPITGMVFIDIAKGKGYNLCVGNEGGGLHVIDFESKGLSQQEKTIACDFFESPIVALMSGDFKGFGEKELVCCSNDGEMRTYMSLFDSLGRNLTKSQGENMILKRNIEGALRKKRHLEDKLRHLEEDEEQEVVRNFPSEEEHDRKKSGYGLKSLLGFGKSKYPSHQEKNDLSEKPQIEQTALGEFNQPEELPQVKKEAFCVPLSYKIEMSALPSPSSEHAGIESLANEANVSYCLKVEVCIGPEGGSEATIVGCFLHKKDGSLVYIESAKAGSKNRRGLSTPSSSGASFCFFYPILDSKEEQGPSECDFELKVIVKNSSNDAQYGVQPLFVKIPKFARCQLLPELSSKKEPNFSVPTSYIAFSIGTVATRDILKFCFENFLIPSGVDWNAFGSSVESNDYKKQNETFKLLFFDKSIDQYCELSLHHDENGSVLKLFVDDIDFAATLFQSFQDSFQLDNVTCSVHFPKEVEMAVETVEVIPGFKETRVRLLAEISEKSIIVKNLIVMVEDARQRGDFESMTEALKECESLNSEMIMTHTVRLNNHEALVEAVKKLNFFIQKMSRFKAESFRTTFVQTCRKLVNEADAAKFEDYINRTNG
eukprot:Nk52_evm50s224 gene=Nk52_evmTU50s224